MDSGLDEWEARAHQTLTDAEQAFLMEDFKKGFSLADSILQEYLMLSGGPSTLDVDQHPEHIQDFMSACIAVCIQCMYEQGEGNKVDDFLKRYYSSLTKMPLQQFVLWSKLHFHLGNYSTIVEKCIEILKTKKFQLDPHLNEGIVEIMVYRGLVPQGAVQEVLDFVKVHKRMRLEVRKIMAEHLQSLIDVALPSSLKPVPRSPTSISSGNMVADEPTALSLQGDGGSGSERSHCSNSNGGPKGSILEENDDNDEENKARLGLLLASIHYADDADEQQEEDGKVGMSKEGEQENEGSLLTKRNVGSSSQRESHGSEGRVDAVSSEQAQDGLSSSSSFSFIFDENSGHASSSTSSTSSSSTLSPTSSSTTTTTSFLSSSFAFVRSLEHLYARMSFAIHYHLSRLCSSHPLLHRIYRKLYSYRFALFWFLVLLTLRPMIQRTLTPLYSQPLVQTVIGEIWSTIQSVLFLQSGNMY